MTRFGKSLSSSRLLYMERFRLLQDYLEGFPENVLNRFFRFTISGWNDSTFKVNFLKKIGNFLLIRSNQRTKWTN